MARQDSIHVLTMKAVRGIRTSLKGRGVIVPDVDGPSDELHLRSLQELQAIHAALDESDQAAVDAASSGRLTVTDSEGKSSSQSLSAPKGTK